HWWLNLVGIRGTGQMWFLVPLGLLLGVLMPYRMRQYADSVEDYGECLRILHGRRDFCLPLVQIQDVRLSSPTQRGFIVKLKLVPKSDYGSTVRFYGALPLKQPTIQADLESLRSRV